MVMRLKFQERSELNFVSRITQYRFIGIGNYPACEGMRDYIVGRIPKKSGR